VLVLMTVSCQLLALISNFMTADFVPTVNVKVDLSLVSIPRLTGVDPTFNRCRSHV